MYNSCVNLKLRTKKGKKYFFCVHRKAEIELKDCSGCNSKEYKKVPKIASKTRIKPISKKRIFVSKKTYDEVFKRDNGCCRICGKNIVELHHVYYRSERKDLIDEPSNCILLCNEHHRLVHSNKKKYQPMLLKILQNQKE